MNHCVFEYRYLFASLRSMIDVANTDHLTISASLCYHWLYKQTALWGVIQLYACHDVCIQYHIVYLFLVEDTLALEEENESMLVHWIGMHELSNEMERQC